MKKTPFLIISSLFLCAVSLTNAQDNPNRQSVYAQNNIVVKDSTSTVKSKEDEKGEVVNGSMMFASKDFIENMANSESLAVFNNTLQKAGLTDALQGKGEFTVFAPTSDAFAKSDPVKMDSLMSPSHQKDLTAMVTYHIVSGRMSLKDMVKLIKKNDGKAVLTTLSGSPIILSLENERLILTDENGHTATITQTDINQKNGTLYLIDNVLTPKKKV